ncbi:unnamed protein product [Trichobilharzia szidati]|nr:unnamed protein product [Trichobilharzia szidati]
MTSDVRNLTSLNNTQNPVGNHRSIAASELETISSLDVSSSSLVSSSEDQILTYQKELEDWLLKAVVHTFSKLSSSHRSFESIVTKAVGLPTSLACALSYYLPKDYKDLLTESKLDKVCLDHYQELLLLLSSSSTTVLDTSTIINLNIQHDLFKDDCENIKRIVNFIQRLNKSLDNFTSLLASITHLLNQYPNRSIDERIGFKQHNDLYLVINVYQLISKIANTTTSGIQRSSVSSVSSTTVTTTTPVSLTSANTIHSDTLQSNYTSRVQNGVLRDLVRTSAVVAKPARPAHPSNQPIPVVNQSTVDQLVSSSTSSFIHSKDMSNCDNNTPTTTNNNSQISDENIHSTSTTKIANNLIGDNEENQKLKNITNDKTNDLLTDIARAAYNRSSSTPCKEFSNNTSDINKSGQVQPLHQQNKSSTNGHYYLTPVSHDDNSAIDLPASQVMTSNDATAITTDTNDVSQPFTRNSLYATFNKRPTPCLSTKLPSIGSLSQPNNPMKRMGAKSPRMNSTGDINLTQVTLPSLRSEFEKRKRSLSSVNPADVSEISKIEKALPLGTTTWKAAGTARSQTRKTNEADNTGENGISSTSTKPEQENNTTPGRAAALRLSLDQRRRAIEVSRQRERLASTKAAANRNNAAFVKLLQEQFHQRRDVPAGESKLPSDKTSKTETTPTVSPTKSNGPENLASACVDAECMHVATDNQEITASVSQVGQATDMDEDFSMLSSSTVPNSNEPLQDNSVFMETSTTVAALDDNAYEPSESVASSPKSPKSCREENQMYDSPTLPVKHSKHHDTGPMNNHHSTQNYQDIDQRSSVSCQRSNSDESDYLPSNMSAPHIVSPHPSSWHQSLPYQRKPDTKRPKSRYSERESTPQPESFAADAHNHHIHQYPHTHKSSKYRGYADKTYPGHFTPSVAYNDRGFVSVDPFHGTQSPRFRRHHINHKTCHCDTSLHNSTCEQPIPHRHTSQRHYRRHNPANQLIQSGSYCDCSSGEASSETDDESNCTCDDHSYPHVNRMAYSGRFSHRSLSRLSKPHSKNRYRSNVRKSTEYGYDYEEEEGRIHSPAGSYASLRGINSRAAKLDMNAMGNNNNNNNIHSTASGVDPATLDQINRNMSDLRSGFERLSMQQQVLLASSSATTAAALVASSFQQQHQQQQQQQEPFPPANSLSQTQGLSTSISNISTTRATWSDRPILRELSVQRNPAVVTNGCNEAVQTILDEGDTDNVVISSDPRMQRTKDRLEARRATERAMVAEQLEALRTTGRKEKEAADRAQYERKLNEKERREAVLQAHLSKKEAAMSSGYRNNNNNNPYPVRSGSSALSKSEVNLSTTTPKHSASKKPSTAPKRDRNAPVAASLDAFPSSKPNSRVNSAKSKAPPPVTTRGSGDGEAGDLIMVILPLLLLLLTSTTGATRTPLPSGISLSSLHRLGASESPSSGPGVPVQCLNQPRLFVKPKAKSNRTVVVNAISHCCLAGTVNEPTKQLALKELAATEGTHFMILFRDSRCQYRAVYSFDLESEELKIICGNGPKRITHEMVNRFFKYNSGAKQFTEITSTKHLSPVVDAVTIHDALWIKSGGAHTLLPSHCS